MAVRDARRPAPAPKADPDPAGVAMALQARITDFLWDCGVAVGLGGWSTASVDTAVDPEALLLLSATFARRNPRLHDEALDWAATNSRWLSKTRLRRMLRLLHEDAGAAPRPAGAARPALTADQRHDLLTALGRLGTETPALLVEGVPEVTDGTGDAVPVRTGRSREPDPTLAASLAFRLRAAFGVCARADVVASLASGQEYSAAEIAARSMQGRRNIESVLTELAYSGLVKRRPVGRALTVWRLGPPGAALVVPAPTAYPPWHALLRVLPRLDAALETARATPDMATVALFEAAELLLETDRDSHLPRLPARRDVVVLLRWFEAATATILPLAPATRQGATETSISLETPGVVEPV